MSVRNPNSPKRFLKERQLTLEGEIAEIKQQTLDEERIDKEAMYDGFTAVCTSLEI